MARFDGALVPFAAYDHGRWQPAWPAADENVDPTPTLTNIPSVWRERGEDVPRLWHVSPVAGGDRIEARVQRVEVVQQEHGDESEVYAIEEVGAADTRRLVQRDAGGC